MFRTSRSLPGARLRLAPDKLLVPQSAACRLSLAGLNLRLVSGLKAHVTAKENAEARSTGQIALS
jgi:hypothetical protein